MKKKVFVTRKIPPPCAEMLKEAGFEVEVSPFKRIIKREELIKNVKGCFAVVSLLTEKIDGEVMNAAGPNLKIVANYAVGFDNIDLKEAGQRKILVTNTPDVLTQAVAEHALALMMSVARRIAESDQFVRAGRYKGFEPELMLGPEMVGKILGIVGAGRIGTSLAHMAYHGLGMKIIYYDVMHNQEIERNLHAEYASLHRLLEQSDFVSLHVPLFPKTHHLIRTTELDLMKKTAILINTSRGPVIDEEALAKALKEKKIWGAGLDVYEFEPKVTPELKQLKNVILTPHSASGTIEARQAMSKMVAENVLAVLHNQTPPNLVKLKG